MLKEVLEDINIKTYNYKNRLSFYKGFNVYWNDKVSHNLTDRYFDRIKLDINTFINKIKKGLDVTIEDIENFDNLRKEQITIYYEISKWYLVLNVTKGRKNKIEIVTFLDNKMVPYENDKVISIEEALKYNLIENKDKLDNKHFLREDLGYVEPDKNGSKFYFDVDLVINK